MSISGDLVYPIRLRTVGWDCDAVTVTLESIQWEQVLDLFEVFSPHHSACLMRPNKVETCYLALVALNSWGWRAVRTCSDRPFTVYIIGGKIILVFPGWWTVIFFFTWIKNEIRTNAHAFVGIELPFHIGHK